MISLTKMQTTPLLFHSPKQERRCLGQSVSTVELTTQQAILFVICLQKTKRTNTTNTVKRFIVLLSQWESAEQEFLCFPTLHVKFWSTFSSSRLSNNLLHHTKPLNVLLHYIHRSCLRVFLSSSCTATSHLQYFAFCTHIQTISTSVLCYNKIAMKTRNMYHDHSFEESTSATYACVLITFIPVVPHKWMLLGITRLAKSGAK